MRLDDDDAPDDPAELPDVVAVDCVLVQPAITTAQQIRKITVMDALAFISDDNGVALFVHCDLWCYCTIISCRHVKFDSPCFLFHVL